MFKWRPWLTQGATHTVVPRDVLQTLKVETVEQVSFQLAAGRTIDYDVGEARVRLDGREMTVLVVFGPEGMDSLLGATTLELFNMAVDPIRRRLVSAPGLLKRTEALTSPTYQNKQLVA